MRCEQCKEKMNWGIEGSTQGWKCPNCGWNLITTYIAEIENDQTEYSLYIKRVSEIDREKIRFVAKIAGVNYMIAKDMLKQNETYLLKAKAIQIKEIIVKLEALKMSYKIEPPLTY